MGVICPLEENKVGEGEELCNHEKLGGTVLMIVLGLVVAYLAVIYLWSAPIKVF